MDTIVHKTRLIVYKIRFRYNPINDDRIIQNHKKKEQAIMTHKLYNETYRPQFHFTAKKNWLNDPNGLVFYKGLYHLFFQHNPTGIDWGNMTWGHAVSPDLVHWKQLDHAIHPDELGTIFSGSAVVDWNNTAGFQKGDEKTIVCIYTSAGEPFTQSIAYSTDGGQTVTPYENNPVITHIIGRNRDPKVIWYEPTKQWIMALFKDGNVFAFLSSPDLKEWTHLHDIEVEGCGECPDFFPMAVDGDTNNIKWVWTAANGNYLVGGFDGRKFTPDSPKALRADWGKNYYAVQTYSAIPEEDGRRIQISWMNGGKYPDMPFNQQMSFPCEMTLRSFPEGLRICRQPVKEIETLHDKEHTWTNLVVKPGDNPLAGITGDLFDIRAEIETGKETEFCVTIRGEKLTHSAKKKELTCLGATVPVEPVDGKITLRILVDRTSIEIFVQEGKYPMTSCFLPDPGNKEIAFSVPGGEVKIKSLTVNELKSAWSD